MNARAAADHSRIVNHAVVPPVGGFEIDPVHTFVGFSAQHVVVGRVRGRFEAVRGTVTVAGNGAGGLHVSRDIEIDIDAEAIRPL